MVVLQGKSSLTQPRASPLQVNQADPAKDEAHLHSPACQQTPTTQLTPTLSIRLSTQSHWDCSITLRWQRSNQTIIDQGIQGIRGQDKHKLARAMLVNITSQTPVPLHSRQRDQLPSATIRQHAQWDHATSKCDAPLLELLHSQALQMPVHPACAQGGSNAPCTRGTIVEIKKY